MYSTEVGIALMGALGVITLSLFTTSIIKYFVGIGVFGVFFLLTYVFVGNLNASVFVGMTMAVLMGSLFEWLIKTDLYSAMLLIVVATIGIILIVILLSALWQFLQLHASSLENNQLFLFHNEILNDYRDLLQAFRSS